MFYQMLKVTNFTLTAPKLFSINYAVLWKPLITSVAGLRTTSLPNNVLKTQKEFIPKEVTEDNEWNKAIISKVNTQIQQNSYGRLFAVVWLMGKQYKVTNEDLIVIEGYWPPTVGDRLRLEKVLLVGGADFTLIGTPVLSRDLVSVTATVIEKTMGLPKTRFLKIPRKQYERTRFVRKEETMLRINKIETVGIVGDEKDIIGVSRTI